MKLYCQLNQLTLNSHSSDVKQHRRRVAVSTLWPCCSGVCSTYLGSDSASNAWKSPSTFSASQNTISHTTLSHGDSDSDNQHTLLL